jgi:membrane-bound lytic murein transglycosylase B
MKDCIGTIANFMHVNGWDSKKVVTVRALFGKDRYKGLTTGYNKLYSLKELKKHNITPTKELDEDVVSLLQLRGKTKDELWLGAKNFRVLTTYNNSTNYGMAIFQIAQRLMK